jgi:hypothetical protein
VGPVMDSLSGMLGICQAGCTGTQLMPVQSYGWRGTAVLETRVQKVMGALPCSTHPCRTLPLPDWGYCMEQQMQPQQQQVLAQQNTPGL